MSIQTPPPVESPAFILEGEYSKLQFPGLLHRIKAFFIDFGVLLAVFLISTKTIEMAGEMPAWIRGVILVFMFCLYDPFMIAFAGGTLGHKAIGLKIKRYYRPEKNLSLGFAFLRFFIKNILGWISFFTVTTDPRKRSIHDLSAGSIVLFKD